MRCWRTFQNGKICDSHLDTELSSENVTQDVSCEGSASTLPDRIQSQISQQSANCDTHTNSMSVQTLSQTGHTNAFLTLSRSLGAKDFRKSDAIIKFNEESLAIDEVFVDAKSILDEENRIENNDFKDRIWVTAAVGIDYDKVPVTTKYTR